MRRTSDACQQKIFRGGGVPEAMPRETMPTLRSVASFLSLHAVGLMLAVAVPFLGVGLAAGAVSPRLDYVSLSLGLLLGLSIGQLARVSWGELPRRMANWLLVNERNFYRVTWAAILLAVLLYY
mgnify:CR=1 FL=1